MAVTNNITRLLDARKIPYTAYELPAEKLGAQRTAEILGVSLDLVYKSIVTLREKPGKPVLAVIPGSRELDLKALAAALGEKKVRLASQREAEQLTGLQVGGISPLALINKGFQIILDQSAKSCDHIHISGGQRGLNLRVPVSALIDLTRARYAPVSQLGITTDELENNATS
jgi:Cys-tRNA(Pro)/Cys-tRNA(Cys) deacylase